MLHIVLFILKVIGIILAVILGLIVLLLCVALFVPLRYTAEGKSDGTQKGTVAKVQLSWLLHVISIRILYKEEKMRWQLKVLGRRIGQKRKKPSDKKVDSEKEQNTEPEESIKRQEPEKESVGKASVKKETPAKETAAKENAQETSGRDGEFGKKAEKKRCQPKREKVSVFQKIRYTYRSICAKIKVFFDRKDILTEFISDVVHKNAFGRVKKELFRLLRFLRPKKLRGQIRFGFEDPYHTGQVLAILGMLYPFYGEYISIEPDFEEKVLEGEIYIKGHIRGVYGVIILWNLFFDKNIRITYKHIRALRF